jgi:hypothetical protein
MFKTIVTMTALAVLATGASAAAQAAEQNAPKTQEAVQPNIPRPVGQLINIKLDLTISDQRGASAPTIKTVTMVLADRGNGRIRTQGEVRAAGSNRSYPTLNVDAQPEVTRDNRVKVNVILEYKSASSDAEESATISESMTVILDDGKPLVVSQSADPYSDRKVKIELKATFLK